MTFENRYVVYYRVSTDKQGRSQLGLEAQKQAVDRFCGSNSLILWAYTEVESGRNNARPELQKAIAHARRSNAKLLVAKLDRLSRNVAFIAQLMDSEVDFVCCDNPYATRLTLHMMSAVAEHEARMTSERTRSALQALKARGVQLGSARPGHWDGKAHLRLAALSRGRKRAAFSRKGKSSYDDIVPLIIARREEGMSWPDIAQWLNAHGHTAKNGFGFHGVLCYTIIARYRKRARGMVEFEKSR